MVAVAILYFRSIHACYIAAGGVLAAIIAKTLKRIIRQPRPAPLANSLVPQAKGYGMPSSHSQVVAYFGVYLQLLFMTSSQHPLLSILSFIVLNGFCISIYFSRVHLGNHSPAQVVVGGILGTLIAAAWFTLWRKTIFPWLRMDGHEYFKLCLEALHLDSTLLDYIFLG
jgi:dolichyldiphosphatase